MNVSAGCIIGALISIHDGAIVCQFACMPGDHLQHAAIHGRYTQPAHICPSMHIYVSMHACIMHGFKQYVTYLHVRMQLNWVDGSVMSVVCMVGMSGSKVEVIGRSMTGAP